jgi:thiol-disulfide isomerase/thioredoxin
MDRLPALIIALGACAALAACDKGPAPSGEAPSRVNGAKVKTTHRADAVEAFCDFHKADDSGPLLVIPPVGEVKVKLAAPGGWTWLNIWATWCHPCVDEMPRIAAWRDKLAGGGAKVELVFVSVDENDDDMVAFAKAHPGAPRSARLADPKSQSAWFTELGLDANPTIPIHVFASPTGHVRCARAGSVVEHDYAAIEQLLAE